MRPGDMHQDHTRDDDADFARILRQFWTRLGLAVAGVAGLIWWLA